MNIPLLRRIQRRIDKAPEHFDIGSWNTTKDCGTAYCIAGWAMELNAQAWTDIMCISTAQNLLEISHAERALLFLEINWPERFQRRCPESGYDWKFHGTSTGNEKAAALAIARIELFIATEGRE